jgi:hypothetical protein
MGAGNKVLRLLVWLGVILLQLVMTQVVTFLVSVFLHLHPDQHARILPAWMDQEIILRTRKGGDLMLISPGLCGSRGELMGVWGIGALLPRAYLPIARR